jgi:peptidoglycan/LPS O-acetylase OafA/YrhL
MPATESAITIAQPKSSMRYASLDCLRGIAAFGVLLTHSLQRVLPLGTLNHTPFRIFVNGRSFVIFFFVLSGFVLANAIWASGSKRGYWNYVARRLVRLYPPYGVAGLFGLVVGLATGNADVLTALANYAAALGTASGLSINPPSWSLVFELRISLVMPLLCLMIARKPKAALVITAVVFCLAEALIVLRHIGQFPYGAETLADALVISLRFLVCFSIGALLAYDTMGKDVVFRVLNRHKILALLVALVLMSVLLDQASLIASVIIISLALNWTAFKSILEWSVFHWLGRISYSLYLTHFLVLTYLASLFDGILDIRLIVLLAIPTALLVAEVFFEFVERPTIAWSRRI